MRTLVHEPAEIVDDVEDVDLADDGAWVAVCRRGRELSVVTQESRFVLPAGIWNPLVRWLPGGQVLVADYSGPPPAPNAFIFDPSGAGITAFHVGSLVEDVVVVDSGVFVVYQVRDRYQHPDDAADCGPCLFSMTGDLVHSYVRDYPDANHWCSELDLDGPGCHCASPVSADCVSFCPTGGRGVLVNLDLRARTQSVHPLPAMLAESTAVASNGREFFFFSPARQRGRILRWAPGGTPLVVGEYPGQWRQSNRLRPIRGRADGTFLEPRLRGYAVVTVP